MLVLDEADEMLNKGEIFISLVLLSPHLFEILISSQLVVQLLKTTGFIKARQSQLHAVGSNLICFA